MRSTTLHSIVLVVVYCCCTTLCAQSQKVRFENVEGISQNAPVNLVQDQQGFLWIGADGGLNKFDGHQITTYNYNPRDSKSLSHDHVHSLLIDHLNVMWVGTHGGGLNRYNEATDDFTRYQHDEEDSKSLSHNEITIVYEDSQGTIWVGTTWGGLNRFDRATGTFEAFYPQPTKLKKRGPNRINAIHEDPNGTLWIGTGGWHVSELGDGGLYRFDRLHNAFEQVFLNRSENEIQEDVWTISGDRQGSIWIGSRFNGAYRMNPIDGTSTHYAHKTGGPLSLSGQFITSIREDIHEPGIIWITSGEFGMHPGQGGLDRLDIKTGEITHYRNIPGDDKSLSSNNIWSTFQDRQGTFWVGAWNALNKMIVPKIEYLTYQHEPDEPGSLSQNDAVTSFYEDEEGILWVTTHEGGLNRWDPESETFTHYVHNKDNPNSLSTNSLRDIVEDQRGDLWIGSRGNGLNRFDPNTGRVTRYIHIPEDTLSLGGDFIEGIIEDQTGHIWVATYGEGVFRLDPETGEFTSFLSDQQKENTKRRVRELYTDLQGTLWAGTASGLARYDPSLDKFVTYLDYYINDLYEDRKGRFWIATSGSGLQLFDRDSGTTNSVSFTYQLEGNTVSCILEDNDGFIWVRTTRGLSRIDPDTFFITNFDGLQEHWDGRFSWKACYKNRKGQLLFGGAEGITAFDPTNLHFNSTPPEVVITDIHIHGEPIHTLESSPFDGPVYLAQEVNLTAKQNDITLSYAGLHYSNPDKHRYETKLEPYDRDWIEVGQQRSVRYGFLRPGSYTFRVRAANEDGVRNDVGASLDFTIPAPWWASRLAIGIYLLALLLGIYIVDRIQRKRLIRKERTIAAIEQAKLEVDAAEAHAKMLEQLDAMKTNFFVNISHEFRTPLHLLLAPLEDALHGTYGEINEPLRKQLVTMNRNGNRLQRLIDQLLDLSKFESGNMQLKARKEDIIEFSQVIVSYFQSQAERKSITLLFTSSFEKLHVYFDVDKLEKVMTNLLSNALKYTPEQGKIRLDVEESDSSVLLTVQDTGIGIASEHLPHIFKRFHQFGGEEVIASTGVGLALCKEMVELHHGTIWCESTPGFGSTFLVKLPLGKDHLDQDELVHDDLPTKLAHQPSKTDVFVDNFEYDPKEKACETASCILIVDDNKDMRDYLKHRLYSHYRLLEADNGASGLDLAKSHNPDLVISDVMMPGMSGYDLCAALKNDDQTKDIPVILLTAKANDQSKIEGFERGADAYIFKPFNSEELLLRVENLIEIRNVLQDKYMGEVRIEPFDIKVSAVEQSFLEKVKEVIEDNLGDSQFGVNILAEKMGMEVRQLQRKLKKTGDIKASVLIRTMRMKRAAQLLDQMPGEVAKVSAMVGYQDTKYFSKQFKEIYQILPSQWGQMESKK